MQSISAIGVVLATVSSFVVGSIWYGPKTFFPVWAKLTKTSDEFNKKNFGKAMGIIGVFSLLTAYVLAHFMTYTNMATGTTGVMNGLQTAFWLWLGLCLTTTVIERAMEERDMRIIAIVAGNRLITLLVMGAILGAFMQ